MLALLMTCAALGCHDAPETYSADFENKPRQTEIADQLNDAEHESRNPVIEIWKDLDGSVPIRGRSLYFRMQDDGLVEFDYQTKKENASGKPRYEYSVERIPSTKISDEEFQRLRSLAKDVFDARDVKKEYESVALTLDVTTKLTIMLKNGTNGRTVVINDSDIDLRDASFEKRFPKSIRTLIREVYLIRVKLRDGETD